MTSATIDFKLIQEFIHNYMKVLDNVNRDHESLREFYSDKTELVIQGCLYQYKGHIQVIHALLVSYMIMSK